MVRSSDTHITNITDQQGTPMQQEAQKATPTTVMKCHMPVHMAQKDLVVASMARLTASKEDSRAMAALKDMRMDLWVATEHLRGIQFSEDTVASMKQAKRMQ